jgi:hypothetical protein
MPPAREKALPLEPLACTPTAPRAAAQPQPHPARRDAHRVGAGAARAAGLPGLLCAAHGAGAGDQLHRLEPAQRTALRGPGQLRRHAGRRPLLERHEAEPLLRAAQHPAAGGPGSGAGRGHGPADALALRQGRGALALPAIQRAGGDGVAVDARPGAGPGEPHAAARRPGAAALLRRRGSGSFSRGCRTSRAPSTKPRRWKARASGRCSAVSRCRCCGR